MENVDYWDKSEEEMRTMDSHGMYPPRIKLEVEPTAKHKTTKAIFNFNIFKPYEALLTTEEGNYVFHIITSSIAIVNKLIPYALRLMYINTIQMTNPSPNQRPLLQHLHLQPLSPLVSISIPPQL